MHLILVITTLSAQSPCLSSNQKPYQSSSENLVATETRGFRVMFKNEDWQSESQQVIRKSQELVSSFIGQLLTVEGRNIRLQTQSCFGFNFPKSDLNYQVEADLLVYALPAASSSRILIAGLDCQLSHKHSRSEFAIMLYNQGLIRNSTTVQFSFLQLIIRICLHNLFHLLGFRSSSFPSYRTDPHYDQTNNLIEMQQIQREVLDYFGCKKGLSFVNNHWAQQFMEQQLMSEYYNKDDSLFISKFMLVLLRASGFYSDVDMSFQQQDFAYFGRNRGCQFLQQDCKLKNRCESEGLAISARTTGFGFCRISKSVCNRVVREESFNCLSPSYKGFVQNNLGLTYQKGGPQSLAFFGSLAKNLNLQRSRRCLKAQCGLNGVLQVEIGEKRFVCSSQQIITSSFFRGILECPKNVQQLCKYRTICPDGCPQNMCVRGRCLGAAKCGEDSFLFQGDCLSICPENWYGLERACVQSCPVHMVYDKMVRQCFADCPVEFQADSNRTCVKTCKPGYKKESSDCKKLCQKYSSSEGTCLSFCSGTLIDNYICTSGSNQCDQYLLIPDNVCTPSCQFYKTSDPTICRRACEDWACQSGCQEKKCVKQCPAALLKTYDLKTCSLACTSSYPYRILNQCNKTCSMLHVKRDILECLFQCPSGFKEFSANKSCLTCKQKVFKGACINTCPQQTFDVRDFCVPRTCSFFSFASSECKPNCLPEEFIQRTNDVNPCIRLCEKLIHTSSDDVRYCVQKCPKEYEQIGRQCKRVSKVLMGMYVGIGLGSCLFMILVLAGICWISKQVQTKVSQDLIQNTIERQEKSAALMKIRPEQGDLVCTVCFENDQEGLYVCRQCKKTNHRKCLLISRRLNPRLDFCPYCRLKLRL